MWRIFRESVWGFFWGKVVSVLGLTGTVQTAISLFNPNWVITVAGIRIDYRYWFGFTMLLAIGIILRILRVANQYRCSLEAQDRIGIIYNERYYPTCRRIQNEAQEIISLGIRVIGKSAVGNVEVFPTHLYPKQTMNDKHKVINRFPLKPTILGMLSRPVNPGVTPTNYVDLFKHRLGSQEISFCYSEYPDEFISFGIGEYELDIEARGAGNQHGYKTLFISFSDKNVLTVETKKGDDYDM